MPILALRSPTDSIPELRNRLLDDALLLIGAVSIPAVVLSLMRIPILGWRPLFIAQLALLGIIWLIWLLRRRLAFPVRIGVLLVTLGVIGVSGYLQLGLASQSAHFVLLFMFTAALFLDRAPAIRVALVVVTCLVLVGIAAINGHITPVFDYYSPALQTLHWSLSLYVVISYGSAISYIGWRLYRDLIVRDAALTAANRELAVRTRQAESVSALKSAILANFGHEFRTPLGGIIGCIELLKLDDLPAAERRSLLEELGRSADRLGGMIDRMLDFANLQGDTARLEAAPFVLREIVDSALAAARVAAAGKDLALALSCADDVPDAVVSDGRRLRQMLDELLANAVAFAPSGRIEVRLARATAPAGDSRTWLRCEVADCGPGIPVTQREAIFEPFHQVDGGPTRKVGGNGLGLAIARRIARLLGGDLTLESSSAGSIFRIVFPVVSAGAAAIADPNLPPANLPASA